MPAADSFGIVDLVVRQGELWRPLSPGRWFAPQLKGGRKIWTVASEWAVLLHGPFVSPLRCACQRTSPSRLIRTHGGARPASHRDRGASRSLGRDDHA